MPVLLPRPRCALTAPFHPCRPSQLSPRELGRFAFCCTFRGLTPPRRYLAPDPPEPGLSSPPIDVEAAIARPAPLVIMAQIAPGDLRERAVSSGAAYSIAFARSRRGALVLDQGVGFGACGAGQLRCDRGRPAGGELFGE